MGNLTGTTGGLDVALFNTSGAVTSANPLPVNVVSGGSGGGGSNASVVSSGGSLTSGTSTVIGTVTSGGTAAPVSVANPMPVLDAYTSPSATTWTTSTAVNTAATVTTAGYDTMIVTLVASASFAGGVVVFEAYDGAAWIPIKAASISDYTTTAATIAPTASSSKGYQVPVAGFPQFRVRLSTVLSAGTLTVTTITSSAPDVSLVTVGLDPAQPLPAGTNNIGQVTIQTNSAASYLKSVASGGSNSARITSGFDGVIKASGGQIYGYDLYNTQASVRYVHFIPTTTAEAASGSLATQPTMTIAIPPTSRVSLSTDIGFVVATGISWGVSTDAAYATQGASGDVVGTIWYA